jgi:ClpP class serine protease
MDFTTIIFIFFLLTSVLPALRQWVLERARQATIREIEQQRHSRVITLIHRQETISLLGLPLTRYIDIDDSEELLRAIRLTSPDTPIDLILHTPGGLVIAAEQIAHALLRHIAPVTVFVPHYALSGGTLVALAADQIVLDPNAVLGPVDPQIGQWPAASVLSVLEIKPIRAIDDDTLILADIARKALAQVCNTVAEILMGNGMARERAETLAHALSSGRWTHDYPISVEEARAMGLPISSEMPAAIYRLMSLYPQPRQRRPSVQYIPMPYKRDERPAREGERGT